MNRGPFALSDTDKTTRVAVTEIAASDLVVFLDTVYWVRSAQRLASGGVALSFFNTNQEMPYWYEADAEVTRIA